MGANFSNLLQKGIAAHQAGDLNEASSIYNQILKFDSSHFDAIQLLGTIAAQTGNNENALNLFNRALAIKKNNAFVFCNKAIVLQELGRFEEALTCYTKAISLKKDYAQAYFNLADLLNQREDYQQSLENYDKAISFKSNYAEAYCNKGLVLMKLNLLPEAKQSFETSIQINANYAEAYNNLGLIFQKNDDFNQALTCFNKAIALNKSIAEFFFNKGDLLKKMKHFDSAIESYSIAICLNPNNSKNYTNLGNVYLETDQTTHAFASYIHALSIDPFSSEGLHNLGQVLTILKRHREAIALYSEALKLKPDYSNLLGKIVHAKMHLCQWDDFETNLDKLIEGIERKKEVSIPFPLLSLTDSTSIHKTVAEIWIENEHPIRSTLGPIWKKQKKPKIRLGYFSADFRNHPVSFLTAELFETHDKDNFELIGFYFGHETDDEMHNRIRQAFDQFHDIHTLSDSQAAMLARNLEIDIAIDLTGITAENRIGVFSYRVAPIQLSYIGYLGTMGAQYYDYLIADQFIIPNDSQPDYVEKIIYLPHFQVNDSKRRESPRIFSRQEMGIPSDCIVFCCFNNTYKITPFIFDSWMRILGEVKNSVLLLYADNKDAELNLQSEASKRKIDSNRLIFCSRVDRGDYLARFKVADLFLDTWPYNAGTTASDSLWMGTPVLTLTGRSFASRVAASILRSFGLNEMITHSISDYEETAIRLGQNPEMMLKLKNKTSFLRPNSDLFNTKLFTKNIEKAYETVYKNYLNDLPISNVYVNQEYI